jgi:PAS domain-containing protein
MAAYRDMIGLIDAFHEAALEPELWKAALTRLGEAVGGSGVVVVSAYDAIAGAHLFQSVGYDLDHWQRVQAEHSTPETNRYINLLNAAIPGQVLQPRVSMELNEWLDDPIYRKFLRPDGLGDGLTCPLFHKPDGFAAVATFRRQHYDTEHIEMLQAAARYVRHALNVNLRLRAPGDHSNAARVALDNVRSGIILTDAHGRTVQVNAAAQRILDRSDGLALSRGGMLVASGRDLTGRLQALLNAAAITKSAARSRGYAVDTPAGGAIRLSRPSGMTPLEVLVCPLRSGAFVGSLDAGTHASVLVSVVDPDAGIEIEAEMLRQMYGLTNAESRLALALLSGKELPAAATALGVTVHTARTLLKRSFERVGVHRQADFIARILGGPLGAILAQR